MLELNKQYSFKIKDVGMNFEGVAKTDDGLTVFVPGTLKDEEVTAKIIKVNKNYALGDLREITKKSSKLLKPFGASYFSATSSIAFSTLS